MREVKETLIELLIGFTFWNIVLASVGAMLSKTPATYLNGSAIGYLYGCAMIFHMYHTSDKALDMTVGRAKKYMLLQTMLRMFVAAALLAGAIYYQKHISPVALFLGIWAVKLAAYIREPLHCFVTGRTIFKRKDDEIGQ